MITSKQSYKLNNEEKDMEIGIASASFSAFSPSNMDKMQEQMQQKLQTKVESGEVSSAEVQSKLQERFADSVNAAFAEDGTIDYDKLGETIQTAMKEKMSSMMPAAMSQMSSGGEEEEFDSFNTLMDMLSQYDDEQDNESSNGTLLNLSA